MKHKSVGFQLSLLWLVISLVITACGASTNCDDPNTPEVERCGTTGSGGTYYRSSGTSYVRARSSGNVGGRSGFGSTGNGRSGFG